MQNIDLTPIIEAAITIIAALVARYLVPWLKEKWTGVKYDNYMEVVKTLVTAAEGIFTGVGRGQEKLEWVKKQLNEKGYDVDIAAIEALVKSLYNTTEEEEEQ